MFRKNKRHVIFVSALIAVVVFFIQYELLARTKIALSNNPIVKDQHSIKAGKALYQQYCQSCHGKAGLGDGFMKNQLRVPPANLTRLDQPSGITAMKIVFGSKPMPAWRDNFTMAQIWHLVNYIESIQIAK